MTYRKYICILISLYFYCTTFRVIAKDEVCDKSTCKGPLKYYEDLKCIPSYESGDNCCPVKYDCNHLKGRSKDKCYYMGHIYEAKERLRAEDATACDIDCICEKGSDDIAQFSCSILIDCMPSMLGDDCYFKKSHTECCVEEQICPKTDTEIARCEVDGKTYLDGQEFTPSSEPTKYCICAEGYKGENVSPFCKSVRPDNCKSELRFAADNYKNCTPVFHNWQNPAIDCNGFSRCQDEKDEVIESTDPKISTNSTDLTCSFGQLTMKIGDELNSGTDYSSICVKCVCEVPPLPTCQRLSGTECDFTAYTGNVIIF